MDKNNNFPINLSKYEEINLEPSIKSDISEDKKNKIKDNIGIVRDSIIFFTALADGKGVGGHTGGAYDITPEALITKYLINGTDKVYPVLFDEAGHRVALQYMLSALNEETNLSEEDLLKYREYESGLPGHPELDEQSGIDFSSGRLGHLWPFCNGIAHKLKGTGKKVVVFSSDGSLQEGNDAEAARIAAANDLPIILMIDDNDVTIEGHPSEYLKNFNVEETLEGHGIKTFSIDSRENLNIDELYNTISKALEIEGPVAIINKRKMAPHTKVEGMTSGHDSISPEDAISYLEEKDYEKPIKMLKSVEEVNDPVKEKDSEAYRSSTEEVKYNRTVFGETLLDIMKSMSEEERENIRLYSADLGGSTRISRIEDEFPERYTKGGVMERGLLSAAAGYGSEENKQGVFATFSVFGSEMTISEIRMAGMNDTDLLCHFSHAGSDWMADNTCHYGVNISFLDMSLDDFDVSLYYPSDPNQMKAIVKEIFNDEGIRFIFSTRSKFPYILDENGGKFFDENYNFEPGKEEVIREGSDGYIITYGEMLYRSLDALEQLKKEGYNLGLINKPTLNEKDEEMLKKVGDSPRVIFVESQNKKTGFGNNYSKWLMEEGYTTEFKHLASTKDGAAGLYEHIPHQGLSPNDIKEEIEKMF